MLEARQASVEPRVISPECGYVLPLVDLLEPYLGQQGVIAIRGAAGSGKSTALRHLAAVHPGRLALFDQGTPQEELSRAANAGLVVAVSRGCDCIAKFAMAPWSVDEVLEYLMAVHPTECADVMRRLAGSFEELTGGQPQLWSELLEEMVSSPDVEPRDALARVAFREPATRLGGFWLVPVLREGRRVADSVMGRTTELWTGVLNPTVLGEAVRLLQRENTTQADLEAPFTDWDVDRQPLAASLLVGQGNGWRPPDNKPCQFEGAYLADAAWSGVALPSAAFDHANLDRANLGSADLRNADFGGASLRTSRLQSADVTEATFDGADLGAACLRDAKALRSTLVTARLVGADLTTAILLEADLTDADLQDAKLIGADLESASLLHACIEGTDFSHANLTGADLRELDLRKSTWTAARFDRAKLDRCHAEGLSLPNALFSGARLQGAHLTASFMPHASLRGANLREAKLAEIAWENADLRDADLSFANFHMGSSRSGHVDSIVPCEGSRTGYYTDEFDEQAYRAPEEIRKANLCGADLRGATVHGTDFYLVDLRGARYGSAQAEHFRRCGAILHTKRI